MRACFLLHVISNLDGPTYPTPLQGLQYINHCRTVNRFINSWHDIWRFLFRGPNSLRSDMWTPVRIKISIYHAHEFYKTIKKCGNDLYIAAPVKALGMSARPSEKTKSFIKISQEVVTVFFEQGITIVHPVLVYVGSTFFRVKEYYVLGIKAYKEHGTSIGESYHNRYILV